MECILRNLKHWINLVMACITHHGLSIIFPLQHLLWKKTAKTFPRRILLLCVTISHNRTLILVENLNGGKNPLFTLRHKNHTVDILLEVIETLALPWSNVEDEKVQLIIMSMNGWSLLQNRVPNKKHKLHFILGS